MTIQCPAKVNLALSVGPPGDKGYHPIASWMVAVDLFDELTLVRVEGESRYEIGWAEDAAQVSPIDWPVEQDLAVRAHRLVERRVGRALPVRMTLRKRIPVGAGLAGGSSDGAGMLRGLNELFGLRMSRDAMVEMAMELGSDVGFFLGSGSAIVTGRGERVEAVRHQAVHLALILPALSCPTGAVYRKFDELRHDAKVDEQAVREVVSGEREPFNDLAEAACVVEPRLADLRTAIGVQQGRAVHVTGSGAGMFIVATDEEDAERMARKIGHAHQVPALAVRGIEINPA